ncbi:MAG: D-tyrosyl-tRNA(Tyr) deacylase [Candidatus Lindowbacteria bacterium RIFCSPLOWO2_12_FULL_62_27]|nr:MAG: D-tyrosyl-tRNA(Tyr) deacylase [Candidatus Lindowbacteria bacterium RIFCSPLOWO2_12_FULL_62_27]OGH63901.1 MAG: D-tyrosyl-tRNA(Tyr) deacylase [Candidatus Lindowbacteria bacterium RIFCSPLOWO2_02_FULL_62_12]
MRALIQRVSRASVRVDEEVIGKIGRGFLILLGVGKSDSEETAETLARKSAALRIFPDDNHKMNISLKDAAGEALVISQFTLYADTHKGHRPAFTDAAPPELAERLYEKYVGALRQEGIRTETGRFAAFMNVELLNEGPVTILLEL